MSSREFNDCPYCEADDYNCYCEPSDVMGCRIAPNQTILVEPEVVQITNKAHARVNQEPLVIDSKWWEPNRNGYRFDRNGHEYLLLSSGMGGSHAAYLISLHMGQPLVRADSHHIPRELSREKLDTLNPAIYTPRSDYRWYFSEDVCSLYECQGCGKKLSAISLKEMREKLADHLFLGKYLLCSKDCLGAVVARCQLCGVQIQKSLLYIAKDSTDCEWRCCPTCSFTIIEERRKWLRETRLEREKIKRIRSLMAKLKRELRSQSGPEVLQSLRKEFDQLKTLPT